MKSMKFHRAGVHLPVADMGKTLTYYRETLGFHDEWSWKEKDGGIQRDDMRLLFAENPAYVKIINTEANRFTLLWFVDNIEAVYSELIEKKIEIISPLQLHPYDLWEFAFIDINGYYIRVAEGVENK